MRGGGPYRVQVAYYAARAREFAARYLEHGHRLDFVWSGEFTRRALAIQARLHRANVGGRSSSSPRR